MDRRTAERRYRQLLQEREAGQLEPSAFDAAVADLLWRDRRGRIWSLDPATGRPRWHDGQRWVAAAASPWAMRRARLAEAGVLLGLAGLLLGLWQSGGLLLYLNAGSAWLGLGSVPLLILLGLGRLRGLRAPAPVGHPHVAPAGESARWYRTALLAAPLALGLLLPARPLDASATVGRTFNAVGLVGRARADQLKADDTARFDLFDWAVALTRAPDQTRFAGAPVAVEGFVVNDASPQRQRGSLSELSAPSSGFSVVRFVVTHCTADAAAVGLSVTGADLPALTNDTWIRVEGHLELQTLEGLRKPVIVADRVQPIPMPASPYLTP